MELSTERVNGMGVGSIPITKIWQYMDRFKLPDWWEPVLLQSDAAIVASVHKEMERGERADRGKPSPKNIERGKAGDNLPRSGV